MAKQNKFSIRETVRKRLKFLVDDEQQTLFDIAKASGVKVNAVRRLYSTGEATIQTVETLLEYTAQSAADALSNLTTIQGVSRMIDADQSLSRLQKIAIFSVFATTYQTVTGPIGESLRELERKYPVK